MDTNKQISISDFFPYSFERKKSVDAYRQSLVYIPDCASAVKVTRLYHNMRGTYVVKLAEDSRYDEDVEVTEKTLEEILDTIKDNEGNKPKSEIRIVYYIPDKPLSHQELTNHIDAYSAFEYDLQELQLAGLIKYQAKVAHYLTEGPIPEPSEHGYFNCRVIQYAMRALFHGWLGKHLIRKP